MSAQNRFDLAVIGGGINGAGIANDAQGRGLRTVLIEMHDLAWATSSASSKLIHGGLRYLEHYEFKLVREALNERETLLRKAPHLIKPMRFMLPHQSHLRPAWMIRCGLYLYDLLGKRKLLPGSRKVDLRDSGGPLKPGIRTAFEYSDCWVDDARLVVLNAVQFVEKGGEVHTRTRCVGARVETREEAGSQKPGWILDLEDTASGERFEIRSASVINAAGPWAADFMTQSVGQTPKMRLRLVRGSHIVVPRLYAGDQAYILQNADGRIVFVIPYLDDYSIIGTTDVDHQLGAHRAEATAEERAYLCSIANEYFKSQIRVEDIVYTWSGVRPLADESAPGAGADAAQAVTRDYSVEVESRGPLLLSIYGGKLTTYRTLAATAVDKLLEASGIRKVDRGSKTADEALPGGEALGEPGTEQQGLTEDPAIFLKTLDTRLAERYGFLSERARQRIARTYGQRAFDWLGTAQEAGELGRQFGEELTAAEVNYLMVKEFARCADDVLWRRTKLGLRASAETVDQLEEYMSRRDRRALSDEAFRRRLDSAGATHTLASARPDRDDVDNNTEELERAGSHSSN